MWASQLTCGRFPGFAPIKLLYNAGPCQEQPELGLSYFC